MRTKCQQSSRLEQQKALGDSVYCCARIPSLILVFSRTSVTARSTKLAKNTWIQCEYQLGANFSTCTLHLVRVYYSAPEYKDRLYVSI